MKREPESARIVRRLYAHNAKVGALYRKWLADVEILQTKAKELFAREYPGLPPLREDGKIRGR